MIKVLGFLLIASVAHANRIFGGQVASIEDFPYQVSIEYNKIHRCGGSIMSATRILTAAHCTRPFSVDIMRIRAGSSLREEGGQVIPVLRKTEHPDYDKPWSNNDVAVLVLEQPLMFNDTVQPIQIVSDDEVAVSTLGVVTGWGITETGFNSKPLLKVSLPKVSDKMCQDTYGDLYNATTMICYGGETGFDSCGNDSGGPLVVGDKQVGVVSFGASSCDGSNPGVYVKLDYFEDFIESVQ